MTGMRNGLSDFLDSLVSIRH
ncbi:hypothetical protein Gotri_015054 [Gossypium trilobum]|uniref:Uncharacterized protein n=1 Tax=Gossypium trilobum TaxID=34281 RepID=A0A7J9DZE5_9ROSI|nr:hypothetical protein [Gossypium trilobum]